jgi:ribosome biogenesis GTPase
VQGARGGRDGRADRGSVYVTGEALEALAVARTGRTVALLGSSGAGKSTIINALLGSTPEVGRARDDSRGRHITAASRRCQAALLLDTPGMRGWPLGRRRGPDGLPTSLRSPRSAGSVDCGTRPVPGCAVRAAVESGGRSIAARELAQAAARAAIPAATDAMGRAANEAKWKAISKAIKRHPKADRWR